MYGLISKAMEQSIYDFLSEDQLRRIPVVDIKKDTVFLPAVDQDSMSLYYILEGKVDVISQAYNGRSFLIDTVSQGEFIGKFSHMRNKNFYADIKTQTQCKLLKLSEIRNEILNDERFLHFFYFKTSNRLYDMYKISMMRTLFTYEEILSYHLLDIADNSGLITDKDKHICLKTSISERQYYYIMKKFKAAGIITQSKSGIAIVDIDSLRDIAFNVINFMKNRI